MRKFIFFLFLSLIVIENKAQIIECNWQTELNVATGYNQNTGGLLPIGSLDHNWRLINIPMLDIGGIPQPANSISSAIQLNKAYVINRLGSTWLNNNLNEERPISPNNTNFFNYDNFNRIHPYRLVREFCVSEEDSINFNLFMKADDASRVSLYDSNNLPVFQFTTVGGYSNQIIQINSSDHRNFNNHAYNGWNYNRSHLLTPGSYTLEIELFNRHGTATGVTLSGHVSSHSNAEILSYDDNCCDVGTVGLLKVLDENCNGEYDPNENVLPGVTFTLTDSNSNTYTGVTDNLGEIIFRNIPFGNYVLTEVVPNGYLNTNSSRQITIDENQQSHYEYFYNCPIPPPSNEGAYCCPESENLVENGNFEFGNTGFSSSYTQNTATLPGQYDVTNSSSNFNATVQDHSNCVDPTAYLFNDQFLLVNGKTTQAPGSESVIWEQTFNNLDTSKEYKFCAYFKNMPQCTFDILPEIRIEAGNNNYTTTINTSSDPCDWQAVNFCFYPRRSSVTLRIYLKEEGLGDGNDLAIDDISFFQKEPLPLSITVQHQGETHQVTGSINSIDSTDDALPGDVEICEFEDNYYWYVAEVSQYTSSGFVLDWSTFGWGNTTGHSINGVGSGTAPWDLTTQFPNYNFQQNTMYVVGMYVPSCCESCYSDGFTYQLIFNSPSRNETIENPLISLEDKKRIIKLLGRHFHSIIDDSVEAGIALSTLSLSPNPADESVNIKLNNEEVEKVTIIDYFGNEKMSETSNGSSMNLNTSKLKPGIYLVKIKGSNHEYEEKLIIK